MEFFTKGDDVVQKKLADMKGAVMSFANATLKYAAIISAMGAGIAAPLNKAIDSLAARSAELYEANRRTGTSIADLQTIAYATGSSIGSVADGIPSAARSCRPRSNCSR